ncbi:hypothetical protein RZS28_08490 [Methylocapsa polymorpha]|uniref:Uncharacterized protein n=1 Tax=Methylocapsa polymorpha TaxID=3080828 RepID=A0ABZ0HWX1_9HYPH|nr:hypothetical protein RZS28_08490 [Methylocapsa sp. RX1]
MAEFHNPHEGAQRVTASEMSALRPQDPDLGAGLSSVEFPSGLHPALAKFKELIHRYPIPSVIAAFVLGIFLARLF